MAGDLFRGPPSTSGWDNTTSEDYVKGLLGLPEKMRVESMIAFGYPDEDKEPIPREELEYQIELCLKLLSGSPPAEKITVTAAYKYVIQIICLQ